MEEGEEGWEEERASMESVEQTAREFKERVDEDIRGGREMTKKDYKLIASVIYSLRYVMINQETVIRQYCIVLKNENPSFDETKFRKACLGE